MQYSGMIQMYMSQLEQYMKFKSTEWYFWILKEKLKVKKLTWKLKWKEKEKQQMETSLKDKTSKWWVLSLKNQNRSFLQACSKEKILLNLIFSYINVNLLPQPSKWPLEVW